MTIKDKYKQAFSVLHTSDGFSLEVERLEKLNKQRKFKTIVATAAVTALILGSATGAYASDVGGIQRTIQIWIQGDQTEATIQFNQNGSYNMDYIDVEGNTRHQGGGGVAISPDGTERPLTEEELMVQISEPDVRYEEDGSVWIYWFDQKMEITDKFNNDICFVKLANGKDTLYMTVKYKDGYATSPHKYIKASKLNE